MGTIIINGISAIMRIPMRTEFLHKQVVDIILLQEVTYTYFDLVRGYNA